MKTNGRRNRLSCIGVVMAVCAWLVPMTADARVLDKVRVSRTGPVATIEIEFMCAMRIVGQQPNRVDFVFTLELSPGSDCLVALRNTARDLRRPVSGRLAHLEEMEFEDLSNGRARLTLRFDAPVTLSIRQTANVHMLSAQVTDATLPEGQVATPPAAVESAIAAPDSPRPPSNGRVSRLVQRPAPGEERRYVIRAAVIDNDADIDRLALEPARSHTIYTSDVLIDSRRWTELRIGFFDTEFDARQVRRALEPAFPGAWIAVSNAQDEESARTRVVDFRTESAGDVPVAVAAGTGSALSPDEQSRMFEDARAAVIRGDLRNAVDLYSRLLSVPDAIHRQEARELLGVALEKHGDRARARAEYQAYLADFPDGADAARVRQRLAAMSDTEPPDGPDPVVADRRSGQVQQDSAAARWSWFGGFSQYYLRGVSLADGPRPDEVAQSALISQAQAVVRRRGERYDVEARSNLSLLYDFDEDERGEQLYVSQAWLDVSDTKTDLRLRAGRQRQSSSGVLNRFDGLHVSYSLPRNLGISVTAGLPVDSPRYRASGDAYFYAAGIDMDNLADDWRVALFANEQIVDGILDRRAMGGEAHYQGERLNLFGLIDYDLSFAVLNTGLVSGVWQLHDRLTLHGRWRGGAAPFLTTRNALIGQPVETVQALLPIYSEGQIRRLARNRTAEERAGAVGLTAALTPRLQFNADFSYLEYSATVASGSVDAFPATGPQYSWGGHIVGSGFAHAASTFIAGYRHDERRLVDDDTVWLDVRLPLSDRFRLQARLEASRRVANQDPLGDVVQWLGRPVLRLWYSGERRYRVELEVGGQWSNREFPVALAPPGIQDGQLEQAGYFLQLGYQLDF